MGNENNNRELGIGNWESFNRKLEINKFPIPHSQFFC